MIEVREGRLGKGVFATQIVLPGQVILRGWGPVIPRRTRHSLQIGRDRHVVITNEIELVNHSCEPSCGVLVRPEIPCLEIHALRRIEPGEELTTDYATFEDEIEFMTSPCACNSLTCRGQITGYRGLSEEARRAYGRYIAAHLREPEPIVSLAS